MKKKEWIMITGILCIKKADLQSQLKKTYEKLGYTVIFTEDTEDLPAEELPNGEPAEAQDPSSGSKTTSYRRETAWQNEAGYPASENKNEKLLVISLEETVPEQKNFPAKFPAGVAQRDSFSAVFCLRFAENGLPLQETDPVSPVLAFWTGHPHLRVIPGRNGEEQLRLLQEEISCFLGEPKPLEIERKYLIRKPDPDMLLRYPWCGMAGIVQTYTHDSQGQPIRLRARTVGSDCLYFETRKIPVSPVSRIEVERRLTEAEYLTLLQAPSPAKRQLQKDRYCLVYEDQYFEIDLYPFWEEQAFLEIELRSEDQEIRFPDFLQVIREVTTDLSYRNYALAETYNCLKN